MMVFVLLFLFFFIAVTLHNVHRIFASVVGVVFARMYVYEFLLHLHVVHNNSSLR